MDKNDARILELQKQVKAKKEALAKRTSRFSPETNCVITMDGAKLNLQTLGKDELVFLMVRLNVYLMSAKDLGIDESIVMSGFTVEQWIGDIRAKLDVLAVRAEEEGLRALEGRLAGMLTAGTKVSLEIDEIEKLLG